MKITAEPLSAWRKAMEKAIGRCTTVAAVNALHGVNKSGMADYGEVFPDRVGSLKALFANKRAQLAQAPLGRLDTEEEKST